MVVCVALPPRMVTCELSRVWCCLRRCQHNMQHMQITGMKEKLVKSRWRATSHVIGRERGQYKKQQAGNTGNKQTGQPTAPQISLLMGAPPWTALITQSGDVPLQPPSPPPPHRTPAARSVRSHHPTREEGAERKKRRGRRDKRRKTMPLPGQ